MLGILCKLNIVTCKSSKVFLLNAQQRNMKASPGEYQEPGEVFKVLESRGAIFRDR